MKWQETKQNQKVKLMFFKLIQRTNTNYIFCWNELRGLFDSYLRDVLLFALACVPCPSNYHTQPSHSAQK